MTQAHKTPGAIVEFAEKMYKAPYAPFYDAYRNTPFEVLDPNFYPGHMKVLNLRTNEAIAVHADEMKFVPKNERKKFGQLSYSLGKVNGRLSNSIDS